MPRREPKHEEPAEFCSAPPIASRRVDPQRVRELGALAKPLSVPDSFFEPLPGDELASWKR